MKNIIFSVLIIFSIFHIDQLFAQNRYLGQLTGSIESNSVRYFLNENTNTINQKSKFASNNYIKVDYRIGQFSSGVQFEAYTPSLVGYSSQFDGTKLTQGFLKYSNRIAEITLGSFYEQFGSGIVYRSFEERSLGLNNSTLGALVNFKPHRSTTIKAFAGKPRNYMTYSSTLLSGADGEVSLLDLYRGNKLFDINIGGSYTNQRMQKNERLNYPTLVQTYAERIAFIADNFTLSIENTHRSNAQVFTSIDGYTSKKGAALIMNSGYSNNGFGLNFNFRRVENMQTRIENTITSEPVFTNFIPALTKQHKYALPNIYPYNVQANNEIGYQIDLNYEFSNPILGGNYPEKISINYANYNNLYSTQKDEYALLKFGNTLLFRDFSFELEKRWNKKLKSNTMFVSQSIDRLIADGLGIGQVRTQVIINELLYRISTKNSIRNELQYAWTNGKEGNWVFALIEYGYAPSWLIYASDMYNYGGDKSIHYYNLGCSYAKNAIRTALSFSRNRAGYQCSGGICRFVPEFKGVSLTITASF